MPKIYIRKKTWVILSTVSVSVLLIISDPAIVNRSGDIVVRCLTVPSGFFKNTGDYFKNKKKLHEENRRLLEKVNELSLEISRIGSMAEENSRLRALLDFQERYKYSTVPAEIIAREPNDWTGSVIINRGTDDGVVRHTAVCSSKGLLGKVVETGRHRSFVSLITHPNFRAGGVIHGSRVNGVIVGAGRGRAKMLYIPLDAEVKKGEVVSTSGLSSIFPEGIDIGDIISVSKSESGLYKIAVIRPYADLYDEEEVLCVLE